MERANKDHRALITLLGELAAAHKAGHITGDVFWGSLERVRCARQSMEDNNLQGADDAISTVLRLLWAYPGSERALEAVVGLSWTRSWRFEKEKAAFIARTTATSITASTQADAATRCGDARTSIVKAALKLDAVAVMVEGRPSLSATPAARAAPVSRHRTFDTTMTAADREKLSVYEGKVDFFFCQNHRIQRAWNNYKQPTRDAMKAVAGIMKVRFNEKDPDILFEFQERLGTEGCSQFGDVEVPSDMSRNLRHAILWRELVCAWYDNLQMAVEADEIRNDGSHEKLREATGAHKHFLIELRDTKKVLKAYQSRLEARKQVEDAAKLADNGGGVGGQITPEEVVAEPKVQDGGDGEGGSGESNAKNKAGDGEEGTEPDDDVSE